MRRSASRFVGSSFLLPRMTARLTRLSFPFESRKLSRYRPTQFCPIKETLPFWYLFRANGPPLPVDLIAPAGSVANSVGWRAPSFSIALDGMGLCTVRSYFSLLGFIAHEGSPSHYRPARAAKKIHFSRTCGRERPHELFGRLKAEKVGSPPARFGV